MTFLTFAGKCGLPSSPPASARADSPSREARAATPRPADVRWRNRRRLRPCQTEPRLESIGMITPRGFRLSDEKVMTIPAYGLISHFALSDQQPKDGRDEPVAVKERSLAIRLQR